jgi:triosephosphate isomerase
MIMRKQIAAANWKMNLSYQQAEQLIDELLSFSYSIGEHQCVLLGVSFPYLMMAQQKLKDNKGIFVCAQNCASTSNGAYTGEVSAEMLNAMNVHYVIIGHSERREYYHENNQLLTQKVDKALENDLKPVFCCGEPLSVREANNQNSFVEQQLKESLFHLSTDQIRNFIIAYEPIWAIGTGKTASSDQAQEIHAHIRSVFASKYGNEVADSISILYGGSVKSSNAADIFGKTDVDGGLVGGASLVARDFFDIINSLKA